MVVTMVMVKVMSIVPTMEMIMEMQKVEKK